jgi:dihydroneopterin aldolase
VTEMQTLAGGMVQRLGVESRSSDRLIVRDFVLPCRIGVNAEERGVTQKVAFMIEADVAPRAQPAPDTITEVPSYDDLIKAIRSVVGEGHVNLVETLAERIAERCLKDPRILSVRVRVEKLERGPAVVGIEIIRPR